MWTRADLKTKAKAAFKANYGTCVGVIVVVGLLIGLASIIISTCTTIKEDQSSSNTVAFIAIAVIAVLDVLVINPIQAGLDYFFLKNSNGEKPTLNDAFYFFKEGRFSNAVSVLFLRDLFIELWTILLIIPGIIKSYEYRMVNYILAENPEMTWKEVLAKSKEMMNGQKGNAFVLDLSFIGWDLLSLITFSLVAIFYVDPYRHATNAELYKALKK